MIYKIYTRKYNQALSVRKLGKVKFIDVQKSVETSSSPVFDRLAIKQRGERKKSLRGENRFGEVA